MSSLVTEEGPPRNRKVGEGQTGSSLDQGSAGTCREGREKGRGEDGRQGRREMEGTVRKEREEPEQRRPAGGQFGKEEGPHPLSVHSSWPLRIKPDKWAEAGRDPTCSPFFSPSEKPPLPPQRVPPLLFPLHKIFLREGLV